MNDFTLILFWQSLKHMNPAPTSYLSLALLSISIGVISQICLKEGMRRIGLFEISLGNLLPVGVRIFTDPFVLFGLFGYFMATLSWMVVLSRSELSVVYPMVSLGYIFTALAGYYLFGENLSPLRISGIALIIFGVYLITRSA